MFIFYFCRSNVQYVDLLQSLSLYDLNHLMYRTNDEEKGFYFTADNIVKKNVTENENTNKKLETTGHGAYNIENYGTLVYCGIEGVRSVIDKTSKQSNGDLGLY